MDLPARQPPADGSRPGRATRPSALPALAVGVLILALSAGWFVLSRFAEGTPSGDAFGESVGVALGLLIAASVVGAILDRRRERARRS